MYIDILFQDRFYSNRSDRYNIMRLMRRLSYNSFHGLLRFMPAIKRISTFTFVDYYAFNQRIQYEL